MQQSPEQPSLTSIPIWSLSDDLLSKIFAYINNPDDRFHLADVCTRWAGVSRMDWTDITCLDLSPIPKENVAAIIQLCPKLESITAQDCELNIKSITENLRGKLRSLRLYRVSANAGVAACAYTFHKLCQPVFSELRALPHLVELVLQELRIGSVPFDREAPDLQIPETVKRLQLSSSAFCSQFSSVKSATAPWGTLECLILDTSVAPRLPVAAYNQAMANYNREMPSLFRLRQLRELSVPAISDNWILGRGVGAAFVSEMKRLDVLCLDLGLRGADVADLVPLFTEHPTLRILIITGRIDGDAPEIVIPPRRRYASGAGAGPLPILRVFIGGQVSQKLCFIKSKNDGLEIYRINLPMPAFLAQPVVAAIFKGSWIAEMIKKGAASNAQLWNYNARMA